MYLVGGLQSWSAKCRSVLRVELLWGISEERGGSIV